MHWKRCARISLNKLQFVKLFNLFSPQNFLIGYILVQHKFYTQIPIATLIWTAMNSSNGRLKLAERRIKMNSGNSLGEALGRIPSLKFRSWKKENLFLECVSEWVGRCCINKNGNIQSITLAHWIWTNCGLNSTILLTSITAFQFISIHQTHWPELKKEKLAKLIGNIQEIRSRTKELKFFSVGFLSFSITVFGF